MPFKDPEMRKQYLKEYREKNKEKISLRNKKYREKNKEKIKQQQKEYRERPENKKRAKEYRKVYYENNKERIARLQKELIAKYRKTNIQFKLSDRLRTRLYQALKGNFKNGSAVRNLGCSIEELKIHLENQFEEGMTWDNWKPDGWHIDHIKPLSKFDLTDPVQFKEAVHYTNLQPLWWIDNLKKGAKEEDEL